MDWWCRGNMEDWPEKRSPFEDKFLGRILDHYDSL
jgi:hypothetical protein